MYAVIKTGGKQYRVAIGDKLKVETLDANEGDTVSLDHVLMVGNEDKIEFGTPTLDTAVQATVLNHGRGKKLRIVKFRRRQNSRTRTGHRQNYTELEITGIGGKAATKKATAKPAAKKSAAKPAAKKADAKPAKKAVAKKSTPKKSGADDLSKISGVGPVIVGKLEKLGITTFQQIIDFTAEDIERIDTELNFKGRIERDDWIKQAKELAKG